jgi:phenylacetate-CoA ligase
LEKKKSSFWIKEGQKTSLKLFKEAASGVPAYKKFLETNKVNHSNIKNWEDFQSVTPMTKKDYLQANSYPSLFWNGDLNHSVVFSSTSGSTGESFYFPRNEEIDLQSSVLHEYFHKNSSLKNDASTLVIVAFGMGVWIGGLITYQAFELAARGGGYNLSILTPGINKVEIFSALQKLSPNFDQTIIVGYPPFVKDLVDEAPFNNVNFKELNIRFLFAAESFTENFRDYLVENAGVKNRYLDTLNIYGTADIGTMAYETPLSILIRTLAVKNKGLFKDLFSEITKTPTLCQFNPMFTNFEEVNGEIYLTANNAMPLVRYAIGDHGGVFSYDKIMKILSDHNIDIEKEIKNVGIDKTVYQLPFVYVYERKDLSTTIYGINIYPEYVKEALLDKSIAQFVTGKFTMLTKFNDEQDQQLEVNIELREGKSSAHSLIEELQKIIAENMLSRSSEYRELTSHLGNRTLPMVKLWPKGDSKYFSGKGKQRWIDNNK